MEKLDVDLNCDMGESYGRFKVGNDEAVMPYITSCSIACGFHGGDPLTIEKTIVSAVKHGVRIGAHPSYPDLSGFGRRNMEIKKDELSAILKYQILALRGLVENCGGTLSYVKPHGALYNSASQNVEEAETIVLVCKNIDKNLKVMGLPKGMVEKMASKHGIGFISEAFADRRYEPDSSLMSRKKNGAVIVNPEESARQVINIVKEKRVELLTGEYLPINAKSICVHGDNPNVVEILKAIDNALNENGIQKRF